MQRNQGYLKKRSRKWLGTLTIRIFHLYFLMSRGMTMGVRAACFDEEGRIFLVRHGYISGWHMPGGGIERHETAQQALSKELYEEGRLELTEPPELVQVYFNAITSSRDHVVFYRAKVRQTELRLPDREIAECGFFALDALPDKTTPATLRRIAELKGERTPDHYW